MRWVVLLFLDMNILYLYGRNLNPYLALKIKTYVDWIYIEGMVYLCPLSGAPLCCIATLPVSNNFNLVGLHLLQQ
jgi:hypothetical protein